MILSSLFLGRKGDGESVQSQGLPEAVLNCLLPVLMSFPAECTVSITEECAIQQNVNMIWVVGDHKG